MGRKRTLAVTDEPDIPSNLNLVFHPPNQNDSSKALHKNQTFDEVEMIDNEGGGKQRKSSKITRKGATTVTTPKAKKLRNSEPTSKKSKSLKKKSGGPRESHVKYMVFSIEDSKCDAFWEEDLKEQERQNAIYEGWSEVTKDSMEEDASEGPRVHQTRSTVRRQIEINEKEDREDFINRFGLGDTYEQVEESGKISTAPSEQIIETTLEDERKKDRKQARGKKKTEKIKEPRGKKGTGRRTPSYPVPSTFPVQVGHFNLYGLGKVEYDRPNFYSKTRIWPVGYKMSCKFNDIYNPNILTDYYCQIIDGHDKPLFQINHPKEPEAIVQDSPQSAWNMVLQRMDSFHPGASSRIMGFDGDSLFGFNEQSIVDWIEALPGAEQCAHYTRDPAVAPYETFA
ncbi:hypothetical protein PROFUN_12709 [Planoprotostelium fungivorum]|nr:hypothetical protein PROFUN_12709 [Planoprotostelium fungivorum]